MMGALGEENRRLRGDCSAEGVGRPSSADRSGEP